MTGRNNSGCRRPQQSNGPKRPDTVPELPAPSTEPTVRRWPHPTSEGIPTETLTAELCGLRRAVDCQTRLLMEIRSLLEQAEIGRT